VEEASELATVDDELWELAAEQRTELKSRLASSDPAKNVAAADVLARARADAFAGRHTRVVTGT
jgi:hypothetical protein